MLWQVAGYRLQVRQGIPIPDPRSPVPLSRNTPGIGLATDLRIVPGDDVSRHKICFNMSIYNTTAAVAYAPRDAL